MAKTIDWHDSYDQIVIGSGGGSVVAALVASDAGRTSLIVEKQDKFGGSTGFSGGVLWIPNNPLMAQENVPDSYERALKYINATTPCSGPGTSPERREAYLKSGPEMVNYLQQKGMRFKRPDGYADYYDDMPGGEPRSRSLIAELFNINQLGEWKSLLSVFPGMATHFGNDEMPHLNLVKRTLRGKLTALKVGLRMMLKLLRIADLRGTGAALQGRLLQIALRERIPIWLNSPVVDLVLDEGRVTGVLIERGGEHLAVQARNGVLINAGGFSRNQAMRREYGRHPASTDWTVANLGDTGEVMRTAIDLGAAVDQMDTAIWTPVSGNTDGSFPEGTEGAHGHHVPFPHHFDMSMPHIVLVDQQGGRFCNEAGSYMEIGELMYERHLQAGKNIPAWLVFDSRHRKNYLWGTVIGKSPRSWFDSGYMKRASNLGALAEQCGVDAKGLVDTIERFNQFCADGKDLDFHRGDKEFDRFHGDPRVNPNPNLGSIEKPPYYAVAVYPGDAGTFGGLVTDVHGRVLRDDNSVIEGLYATGNSTASVMGRRYIGAGASIGAAFVFGYRAAQHMCSAD